jgi:hypothetical protein
MKEAKIVRRASANQNVRLSRQASVCRGRFSYRANFRSLKIAKMNFNRRFPPARHPYKYWEHFIAAIGSMYGERKIDLTPGDRLQRPAGLHSGRCCTSFGVSRLGERAAPEDQGQRE